ncbi:MAG: ABC transporter ATP-binding protein [Deltaproteobacteria bacterium]|nr:ABC transporter ATP-binding protein [Deltaproteobacteria bacterium]
MESIKEKNTESAYQNILKFIVLLKPYWKNIIIFILTGLVLTVFRALFSSIRNYYISYVQHAMAYDIELKFFRHLQKLSFTFFDSREIAEVLSRFRDAAQSRRILIDILNRIVTNLLYLTIVPMIVFFMNWKLALIAGIREIQALNIENRILNRIKLRLPMYNKIEILTF